MTSKLAQTNLSEARDHEVLEAAFLFNVVGFHYRVAGAPYGTLDLVLEKAGEQVTLHFEGVQEFRVDPGFPFSSAGTQILDVAYLGWENVRIRVQGFDDGGAPELQFWASSVTKVSSTDYA